MEWRETARKNEKAGFIESAKAQREQEALIQKEIDARGLRIAQSKDEVKLAQEVADFEKKQAKEREALERRRFDFQKKLAKAQVETQKVSALIQAEQIVGEEARKRAKQRVYRTFSALEAAMESQTFIPSFARGGSFTTKGPQMFLAGDNPGGRERVDISPISGATTNNTTRNITVNATLPNVTNATQFFDEVENIADRTNTQVLT